MDDFSKYEELRDSGSTAKQVHEAGKADGLDSITLIRLVRKVFDLSLADAKRVIVGDSFDEKPLIQVGCTAYWEGYDPDQGVYLMQGRVISIEDQIAHLDELKKFQWKSEGLVEVGPAVSDHRELAVSFLERRLTERLAEALQFLKEPAVIDR
jgi:hypothetical protein